MEAKPRELRNYRTHEGDEPFQRWLKGLRDGKARGIIRIRMNRLQMGNFGNCAPVGDGVSELKIDFGPGYRVYFGVDGSKIILLGGGDKGSQGDDIRKAKERWRDYHDPKDQQLP